MRSVTKIYKLRHAEGWMAIYVHFDLKVNVVHAMAERAITIAPMIISNSYKMRNDEKTDTGAMNTTYTTWQTQAPWLTVIDRGHCV